MEITYWLALAAWFGGVFFVMLAARVIFRAIAEAKPILPNVLAVNLENEHGTVLAGTVMGNLLAMLGMVQNICGAVLARDDDRAVFSDRSHGEESDGDVCAGALLILSAAAGGYDRFVLWPRIIRFRDEFIAHADEPEIANPAKDNFDREQRNSMNLLMMLFCLLALLVGFSANISPAPAMRTVVRGAQ